VTVFVDTSALFALLDVEDAGHASAFPAWRRGIDEDVGFVTTNYVALETAALAQRRLGIDAVRTLCDELLPMIEILWVTVGDHDEGLDLLLLANRRQLSLVDCVSFAVMRRQDIREYLGLDPHFAEQGFTPIAAPVE
jgi:predicted nucleic acid-binding protein